MAHFDETLLDEFVDFFEWIYAVNIPQDSRDELFDYVSNIGTTRIPPSRNSLSRPRTSIRRLSKS